MDLATLSQFCADEDKAIELFERWRWPDGPVCPFCDSHKAYRLASKPETTKKKNRLRRGVLKCAACRKTFTAKVGTVFEDSHIPISKWLLGFHLLCSSKKGMSSHQLHRALKITYKSAWFMTMRIREAMRREPLSRKLRGVVEADETYIGGRFSGKRGRGAEHKVPVVSLVERGGHVRSFPVERVTAENLKGVIKEHVSRESHIITDDFTSYRGLHRDFASHQTVAHSKDEYVRGPIHTNTVEGFFSILKRGINGVYHHTSKHHLPRYLDEFDFRYNSRRDTDGERTELAVRGAKGKRLMFREPTAKAAGA
jgi:transposase-like protein